MPNQNVYVTLTAKDQISRALKNVNRGLASLRGAAGQVGAALKKAGAIAIAAGAAIAGGLIAATKAAAEEEKGIKKLSAVIAANVKERVDLEKVEARIAEQQARLAYSDGELRDSLAALLPFTKDTEKAFKLQGVAADFARMKNVDLETASKQIGQALGGNTRVLKQLGIELPKTAKKADILAAIQAKVAGQAEAYANSTEGQFVTLQNSLEDVTEDIGKAFLPYALKLAKWARDELLPAIQAAIPYIIDFGKRFVEAAVALGRELLPDVLSLGRFLKDEVLPPIIEFGGWLIKNRTMIVTLAGAIAGAVIAFKAYAAISTAIRIATEIWAAKQALLNIAMAANPIGAIVAVIGLLIGAFVAAYASSEEFRNIVNQVFEALKPVGEFIMGVLAGAFETIVSVVKVAIDVLGTLFDLIGAVVKAFVDSPIGQIIGAVGGLIGDAAGAIFGGGKAKGGPVRPGAAYLVGERGPEMFRPSVLGRIVPNHQLTPAIAGPAGLSGSDLRSALTGLTVVMDGERVGRLVDTRMASQIRGARTSTRL